MDFPPARRKLNTYGKGTRKHLVHDLYNFTSSPSEDAPPTSSSAPSLAQAASESPSTSELENAGALRTRDLATASHSLARGSQSSGLKSRAPHTLASRATESLFDIHSSDDDDDDAPRPAILKPAPKKRKVLPGGRGQTSAVSRIAADEMAPEKPKPKTGIKAGKTYARNPAPKKRPPSTERTDGLDLAGHGQHSTATQKGHKLEANTTNLDRPARAKSPRKPTANFVGQSKGLQASRSSSAHLSDASNQSRKSRQSTPKRKRLSSDVGTPDAPSPSELPMTALKLASDLSSPTSARSSDNEMTDASAGPYSPRKSRTRLVDRLDAPRSQSLEQPFAKPLPLEVQRHAGSRAGSGLSSSLPRKIGIDSQDSKSNLDNVPSSKPVLPVTRPRVTYAKQRSHLSDMVDGLEGVSAGSSQPSSQQSFSQPLSYTSAMDLDLDDSDEDMPNQLKSIHELRRGAQVSKFDLELYSLLEDVESDSKGLRIQALLQLLQKLEDREYAQHFQDFSNFHKFASCMKVNDPISSALMALVLKVMVLADKASPRILLQAQDALYRIPPALVSESRLLSKIARDRSQNISKLVTRDLVDFEKQQESGGQLEGHDMPGLSVSLIILSSLEATLLKLKSLGDPISRMSRRLCDELVSLLNQSHALLGTPGKEDCAHSVRLCLSLLELAVPSYGSDSSNAVMGKLATLGDSLAGVITWARQSSPDMVLLSLRLMLTLSNNAPLVCSALSRGSLIPTVTSIVYDNFARLAWLAAKDEEIDPPELDAVILALGSLLNFTECQDATRMAMMEIRPDGRSLVDKLVYIFNKHVDQTSEAITIEQSQILVPFGYLSCLLCTLCLNPAARRQITESSKGEGLDMLFTATETFLTHMETVEAALAAESGRLGGFTGRFKPVFNSVKQGTV